jgi:hypothetical protein
MYTYIILHKQIWAAIRTYIHLYVYMYIHVYTYIYIILHIQIWAAIRRKLVQFLADRSLEKSRGADIVAQKAYAQVSACVHLYIYVCMYVCMYIDTCL